MLKVILGLGLVFASTFILLNLAGVLSAEQIKLWLMAVQNVSPWVIAALVACLLFADLFVAMPTLTIMLLAGFFLGPVYGAISVICGLTLAGVSGYTLSSRWGDKLLSILLRNESDRHEAVVSFQRYGTMTILLSRAMPILPEVSACMAGLSRMPFNKFALTWLASTVPYAIIATYAGSISNLANPQPAIFAAIGLTGFMWVSWLLFRRYSI